MDWEDARPKPDAQITIGADLSVLSVTELEDMCTRLKAEIERIETMLAAKRAHSAAASALFKS
ncbi:MAG: DUF1192 domain-containing protein [Hyphomicrobiaceae bacterium]|nr:DUF1192 domain-containing protein [Hyphomicrobiaceae bacterium]